MKKTVSHTCGKLFTNEKARELRLLLLSRTTGDPGRTITPFCQMSRGASVPGGTSRLYSNWRARATSQSGEGNPARVPGKKLVVNTLQLGLVASARGWFSRAYFTCKLFIITVETCRIVIAMYCAVYCGRVCVHVLCCSKFNGLLTCAGNSYITS